jgi:hypothetical protein
MFRERTVHGTMSRSAFEMRKTTLAAPSSLKIRLDTLSILIKKHRLITNDDLVLPFAKNERTDDLAVPQD